MFLEEVRTMSQDHHSLSRIDAVEADTKEAAVRVRLEERTSKWRTSLAEEADLEIRLEEAVLRRLEKRRCSSVAEEAHLEMAALEMYVLADSGALGVHHHPSLRLNLRFSGLGLAGCVLQVPPDQMCPLQGDSHYDQSHTSSNVYFRLVHGLRKGRWGMTSPQFPIHNRQGPPMGFVSPSSPLSFVSLEDPLDALYNF